MISNKSNSNVKLLIALTALISTTNAVNCKAFALPKQAIIISTLFSFGLALSVSAPQAVIESSIVNIRRMQ